MIHVLSREKLANTCSQNLASPAKNADSTLPANTHTFFSTTLSDIRPKLPSALLDEICDEGNQMSHRGTKFSNTQGV